MSNKVGRFYGLGVGPGDPELMTLKASRVLLKVPFIFLVPDRVAEGPSYLHAIIANLTGSEQNVVELAPPLAMEPQELAQHWKEATDSIWGHLEGGEDCALVSLGDPLLHSPGFSIMESLRREHPELVIEIIPGISSISAATARAFIPLGTRDERIAILTGRCDGEFMKETLLGFESVIFMKITTDFHRILSILEELNLVGKSVFIRKCSSQDEEIITDVGKLKGQELDFSFSLLIVRR